MSTLKKKGLGRGLDALLGGTVNLTGEAKESVAILKLTQLQRGKYQPRIKMQDSTLNELAESIKTQGIMQPLLVRSVGNGKYEIIAGERRFRAAGLAGLTEVPALIKDVDDKTTAAMALIENMQREDLNPLEEAEGMHRLIAEFGFTHEQAANVVGKSRSAVTNLLRLTQLTKPVQALLTNGEIDMGHARALLPLSGAVQVGLAQRIAAQGLSVREAEKLAASLVAAANRQPGKLKLEGGGPMHAVDPDITGLMERMSDAIGLAVEIKTRGKKGGELKIKFSHPDELENMLRKLGVQQ
jgi:ParB family chromosome partitioning protein